MTLSFHNCPSQSVTDINAISNADMSGRLEGGVVCNGGEGDVQVDKLKVANSKLSCEKTGYHVYCFAEGVYCNQITFDVLFLTILVSQPSFEYFFYPLIKMLNIGECHFTQSRVLKIKS